MNRKPLYQNLNVTLLENWRMASVCALYEGFNNQIRSAKIAHCVMQTVNLLIIISLVQGCSLNYVDSYGANHTIGFAHVIQKKQSKDNAVANIHQIKAIGVYFISMEQSSSFGIGYTNSYEISVDEDNAVSLDVRESNPADLNFMSMKSLIERGNDNGVN